VVQAVGEALVLERAARRACERPGRGHARVVAGIEQRVHGVGTDQDVGVHVEQERPAGEASGGVDRGGEAVVRHARPREVRVGAVELHREAGVEGGVDHPHRDVRSERREALEGLREHAPGSGDG
jgi:hypothetical protein